MPRIWLRYVDDVFALVQKDKITNILTEINKMHPTIQFIMEMEANGSLPFLDFRIVNSKGKFNSEIYKKTTATQRRITTSAHTIAQKMAAYNSIVHRLCTYPLLHL